MKKFNYTHDDNEVAPKYIGKIKLDNIGDVDIIVISNDDGIIPRFYIFNNHFESSICIYDNKYYGETQKLNNIQKKQLNEYLKTKYISFIFGESEYTIWQHLAYSFNTGNINNKYEININEQPDYELMEESIYE